MSEERKVPYPHVVSLSSEEGSARIHRCPSCHALVLRESVQEHQDWHAVLSVGEIGLMAQGFFGGTA